MEQFLSQLARQAKSALIPDPEPPDPGPLYRPRPLVYTIPVSLNAGVQKILRSGDRYVTSLLVQVQSGVLDLYFGETAGIQPPMRFQEGLGPQQVFLGARDYVFCCAAPIDVTAVVTMLGPADG